MGPKSLTHGGRSGVVAHYARTVGVVLVRARILPGLEVRVDLGMRKLGPDGSLDLLHQVMCARHAPRARHEHVDGDELVAALGARAETMAGLSGMGDLVLTCSSTSSRNFSLGKALGEGASAAALMADRRTVAEGTFTAPVLADLAQQRGIAMPIVTAVDAILKGANAPKVVAELLARPLRAEIESDTKDLTA